MFTVYDVIAFNGERGIAYDRIEGAPYRFNASNIALNSRRSVREGSVVLLLPGGVLEDAIRHFRRFYGEPSDEQEAA